MFRVWGREVGSSVQGLGKRWEVVFRVWGREVGVVFRVWGREVGVMFILFDFS